MYKPIPRMMRKLAVLISHRVYQGISACSMLTWHHSYNIRTTTRLQETPCRTKYECICILRCVKDSIH